MFNRQNEDIYKETLTVQYLCMLEHIHPLVHCRISWFTNLSGNAATAIPFGFYVNSLDDTTRVSGQGISIRPEC